MARLSRRRLAAAVVRRLTEARTETERHTLLRQTAAYLVHRGQARQLDLFIKDITLELAVQQGMVFAEVASAHALSENTRQALQRFVQQQTRATSVELNEQVDPALLGGFRLRTPSAELDATARQSLKRLASLNSGGNV